LAPTFAMGNGPSLFVPPASHGSGSATLMSVVFWVRIRGRVLRRFGQVPTDPARLRVQAQTRFMSPETHIMDGGGKYGRLRRQHSGSRTWGRVRAPRGLGVCPERSLPDPVGRGRRPREETRREEDAARAGHCPTRGDWDAGRDPDAGPLLAHAGRLEP